MGLRAELTPPALDGAKVRRLAAIANQLDSPLDGTPADDLEGLLRAFNLEAGTTLELQDFRKIYGSMEHEDWVREVLYRPSFAPVADLSLAEMTEIVSRVVACAPDHDFYLGLFLANCRHPSGSDLIFWPDLVPELPRDREPTIKEVAELAMTGRP